MEVAIGIGATVDVGAEMVWLGWTTGSAVGWTELHEKRKKLRNKNMGWEKYPALLKYFKNFNFIFHLDLVLPGESLFPICQLPFRAQQVR